MYWGSHRQSCAWRCSRRYATEDRVQIQTTTKQEGKKYAEEKSEFIHDRELTMFLNATADSFRSTMGAG